ncbi:hypothetical protein ACFVWT_18705 [Arthrobacter sp. NPDC058288]|uniref:hypothetical protein n=1 Tax=Arthrobacter sp. NPDC058288 TaxID=3346424 RepID=UPI0036E9516B
MAIQQLLTAKDEQLVADFVVTTLEERDSKLDSAVSFAHTLASIDAQLGILVTRHDFWRFSVSLSEDVPYGQVQECDLTQP